MSVPFRRPKLPYAFDPAVERLALDGHFDTRQIPRKSPDHLLMASWNIANLGVQRRSPQALAIIGHILNRFDLIAVQEVNARFGTFADLVAGLDGDYGFLMTDTAGNDERLAFVFDRAKVQPRHLIGELALRDREFPTRDVTVSYRRYGKDRAEIFPKLRFRPFDRNPFIGSFACGAFNFTLVNCHLYFGAYGRSAKREQREKFARRVLEVHALAKWAARRETPERTYDANIILTGDMNVPRMEKGDPVFNALTEFGFDPLNYVSDNSPLRHASRTGGSNLGNDKTYDQMVFAPGRMKPRLRRFGVFDFDSVIFQDLWTTLETGRTAAKRISDFNAHVRYHISDHRPLWVQLDVT